MPIDKINEWLESEKKLGSAHPERMVLATAGKDGIPHSRIVAIREINQAGILFFTQRGTRKTIQIQENPQASMTLWLPLQQREVILDGKLQALSQQENEYYWQQRRRDIQLRFLAFSPTSGHPIHSLKKLEEKYTKLATQFQNKPIPISEYYCGYRLIPDTFVFYTLDDNAFSEVVQYTYHQNKWLSQLLSP